MEPLNPRMDTRVLLQVLVEEEVPQNKVLQKKIIIKVPQTSKIIFYRAPALECIFFNT